MQNRAFLLSDAIKFNFVQAATFAEKFEIRLLLGNPAHFAVNFTPEIKDSLSAIAITNNKLSDSSAFSEFKVQNEKTRT